jgi:hypothetical protein
MTATNDTPKNGDSDPDAFERWLTGKPDLSNVRSFKERVRLAGLTPSGEARAAGGTSVPRGRG